MAARRRCPILVASSLVLVSCASASDDGRARSTAAPSPTPSPPPAASVPEPVADDPLEAVFEGVRGYSFAEGKAATEKRLSGLFSRNAPAPIEALTLKSVRRRGRPIPAMVLVAFFDVQRSKLPAFYRKMLLDMSKAFESATPALGGLGVHFENPGSEAVAYPGPSGQLVYLTSPARGLVIPLAEAMVAAESR